MKHEKAHFTGESWIDDGSFAELEIPIMSLEVGCTLGQGRSSNALIQKLVGVVVHQKTHRVILGDKYLAVRIQVLILIGCEHALIDRSAGCHGDD